MVSAQAEQAEAFVAVGSNIDPDDNVVAALDLLIRATNVVGVSTMYRTAPLGGLRQPPFVNGVWQIRTSSGARDLKHGILRDIEASLGRVRTSDAYAARTIDLDIAIYGDLVINEPGLVIPDPDILKRPFVAVPLLELAPDLCLPDSGLRLADQPVCRASGLEPLPELTSRLRERIAK